jgi:hypothetical protein
MSFTDIPIRWDSFKESTFQAVEKLTKEYIDKYEPQNLRKEDSWYSVNRTFHMPAGDIEFRWNENEDNINTPFLYDKKAEGMVFKFGTEMYLKGIDEKKGYFYIENKRSALGVFQLYKNNGKIGINEIIPVKKEYTNLQDYLNG